LAQPQDLCLPLQICCCTFSSFLAALSRYFLLHVSYWNTVADLQGMPAMPRHILRSQETLPYIYVFLKKEKKNLNARPIAAGSHAMLRVPQVEDHDHVMGGPCGPRSPAATAMFTLSPAFQAP
jgi:hypothetical protein